MTKEQFPRTALSFSGLRFAANDNASLLALCGAGSAAGAAGRCSCDASDHIIANGATSYVDRNA